MRVDSRATTARPAASASRTSDPIVRRSATVLLDIAEGYRSPCGSGPVTERIGTVLCAGHRPATLTAMPARPTRPMTPADIARQVNVEELDLSADGRLAIVVRRAVRRSRYVSHLYAVDIDGPGMRRPRRLTTGPTRDTKPRLSQDGRTIAFIRSDPFDDDAPSRLCLLRLGSDRVATRRRVGHGAIAELAWSPDGRRLAFTAEVDPPRFLVGDVARVDDTAGGASPTARRITRTDWRWDEEGHRDRWSHLFILDDVRATTRPRQVTRGDWGPADIAWAPDARTIVFAADRGPEPDLHPRATVWAVDVDAPPEAPEAEPCEILAPGGWAGHPSVSPDGRWVATIGVAASEPLDDVSPTVL